MALLFKDYIDFIHFEGYKAGEGPNRLQPFQEVSNMEAVYHPLYSVIRYIQV